MQIHLPYGSKGIFYISHASWTVDSHGAWQEKVTVGDSPPGMYKLIFSESSSKLEVTGGFTVRAAQLPYSNYAGYSAYPAKGFVWNVEATWNEESNRGQRAASRQMHAPRLCVMALTTSRKAMAFSACGNKHRLPSTVPSRSICNTGGW